MIVLIAVADPPSRVQIGDLIACFNGMDKLRFTSFPFPFAQLQVRASKRIVTAREEILAMGACLQTSGVEPCGCWHAAYKRSSRVTFVGYVATQNARAVTTKIGFCTIRCGFLSTSF